MNDTLLTQLAAEVERCEKMVFGQRENVAALRSRLSEGLQSTESLARAAEACEDRLVDGTVPATLLLDLQFRHAESESAARRLAAELRLAERLLNKGEAALAEVRGRADMERRMHLDRAIAEVAAPILDSVVSGLQRLLLLAGGREAVAGWILAQSERRDLTSGYFRSVFCSALEGMLTGKETFLADFIADLQVAAPDLITEGMMSHLDDVRRAKEVAIGREMDRTRAAEAARTRFGSDRLAAIQKFNELMAYGRPTA